MDQLNPRKKMLLKLLSPLAVMGLMFSQPAMAEDNWRLFLKNAYIDRDFDNDAVKDRGSWSQAASLFYTSDYYNTGVDELQIGLDASVQYAVRLSNDKGIADTVLPFENGKQANDFLKYGGTLKAKYKDNVLRVGELWPDIPLAHVDGSRQLTSSALGVSLNSKVNDKLTLEVGRITKYSARDSEDFSKMSYAGLQSDGLNYFDARYKFNDSLKGEYYFGNLEDLFNEHYVALDHTLKLTDKASLQSKVRYFNVQDNNSRLDIDSQNVGILETVRYGNHSLGVGFQKIIGDTQPFLDGYIPEVNFINWNVTGFFKEDEESWHVLYGYNFKDYVPGLTSLVRYASGDNFKTGGLDNKESELDVGLSYSFQNPTLKGLGLQYLYVDYDVDHGNDFVEQRAFVTYTKKF